MNLCRSDGLADRPGLSEEPAPPRPASREDGRSPPRMNFDFSDDQKLLQQTARDFLAEHSG